MVPKEVFQVGLEAMQERPHQRHPSMALEEWREVPVALEVKVEPRDLHQVNPQRVAQKVDLGGSGTSNPSAELKVDLGDLGAPRPSVEQRVVREALHPWEEPKVAREAPRPWEEPKVDRADWSIEKAGGQEGHQGGHRTHRAVEQMQVDFGSLQGGPLVTVGPAASRPLREQRGDQEGTREELLTATRSP